MPATVADPNRSLDSEQISPAAIARHTVYEKTPNLHQSHICQWGAQPYLVGLLSRLVGKPPLSPWVSTNVLPLIQGGNYTNSAISLTVIFDRNFFLTPSPLSSAFQNDLLRETRPSRLIRVPLAGRRASKVQAEELNGQGIQPLQCQKSPGNHPCANERWQSRFLC